ncbi:small conductance mechanosensitive channel [Saccharicrinis carchari]|uniref:Small conductance mechanosensitive channel n=1 Tax=Saccharicrinis carchari TaxID=1168039 RepID=A0A521DUS9_SACCC|nr:mechanosensitive ion channel family protein [Saccharicrinis carchari]SMO75332.1 small conductance mechanosensitive channel [Saccharicrinis carchari]
MEKFFTSEFWSDLIQTLGIWAFTELPGILIITIGLLVVLRIVKFTMRRFKKVLIHRAEQDDSTDNAEATKRINTLTGIISGTAKIAIVTVYVIMLLSKFSIDVAPLLASAGILGLAVGFGAQELVRDYISGFFMLLEDQVRTGDVAIINGTGGVVERIELRTITLRDLSGVVHIFQNGKISTLSNMTKDWSAMVFDIGVAYKESVDEVIKVIEEVAGEMENEEPYKTGIIEPIEVMGLDKFGDSALVIKARFKTKAGQQWTVGREYRKRLKVAFDAKNIEIPFPHTTIYWGDEIDPLKLTMNKEEKPQKA